MTETLYNSIEMLSILNLTTFFLSVLLGALLIFGVKQATSGGMILNPLVNWIEPYKEYTIVNYLTQPLFDCVFCMPSFWGLVYLFVVAPAIGVTFDYSIVSVCAYILILCGFVTLIVESVYSE